MKKKLFENVGGNQFKLSEYVNDENDDKISAIKNKAKNETWVTCPKCDGKDPVYCRLCSGAAYFKKGPGTVPQELSDAWSRADQSYQQKHQGRITCPDCGGSGRVDRQHPKAAWKHADRNKYDSDVTCTRCGGDGSIVPSKES